MRSLSVQQDERAAELIYRRALAIDEKSFGPEHPAVARDLNNLAQLLQATTGFVRFDNLFAEVDALKRYVATIADTPPRTVGERRPCTSAAPTSLRG